MEQYRDRFIGRIQAVARTHDQLLETNWKSADLATLVRTTLSAYGRDGAGDQLADNPDVRLRPKQGLGLALVLHELATNASKYGALSTASGKLDISWEIVRADGQLQVRLVWCERDGPPAAEGAPIGFGTNLVKRACDYELGGSAELHLGPKGERTFRHMTTH